MRWCEGISREAFTFDEKYINLVSAYRSGDTLVSSNPTLGTQRMHITGIDSSMSHNKNRFMSPRPSKLVQLFCNPLDYNRSRAVDTNFVLVNIYPDKREQSCHFLLLNFRGNLNDESDSMVAEFKPLPEKLYRKCFVVRNNAADLIRTKDDIEYIYMQEMEGIVAWKSYKRDWWIRQD